MDESAKEAIAEIAKTSEIPAKNRTKKKPLTLIILICFLVLILIYIPFSLSRFKAKEKPQVGDKIALKNKIHLLVSGEPPKAPLPFYYTDISYDSQKNVVTTTGSGKINIQPPSLSPNPTLSPEYINLEETEFVLSKLTFAGFINKKRSNTESANIYSMRIYFPYKKGATISLYSKGVNLWKGIIQ